MNLWNLREACVLFVWYEMQKYQDIFLLLRLSFNANGDFRPLITAIISVINTIDFFSIST